MHFCYILPPIEPYSPHTGGAIATCTMQQAKHLIARGHKVTILSPDDKNEVYPIGDVVLLKGIFRRDLNLARRFLSTKILRRKNGWQWLYYDYYRTAFSQALQKLPLRPDVLFCHNDFFTARDAAAVFPNIPTLLNLHNEVISPAAVAQQTQKVAQLVGVSAHIEQWITKTYDLAPESVKVITNGVDNVEFHPRPDFLSARETGAPLQVLFIGRINHDKGPDIVTEAVAQLRAEGIAIELTVAGNIWFNNDGGESQDPYFVSFKKTLQKSGARHLGHVARGEVPALVRAQDVVCVPSRWNDPCPLTPIEGMASGCAVVATLRGGIPDACGTGDEAGALLVEPQVEAFVTQLRRLAEDEAFLQTWKQRGLKRASGMSWENNAIAFEQVALELQNSR